MLEPSTSIPIRRVRFDISKLPLHWVPGDPQTTHIINVLHLLLPKGEQWFVRVLREALPLITDPKLAREVRAFSGQEGTHAVAHARLLEHLHSHGIETQSFTRFIDWLFDDLGTRAPLGIALPGKLDHAWLLQRLAIIAAIEHYTAFLGEWVIEHAEALDEAGADPTMMDILRWHGAEELEHRSVAFEATAHAGVGWAQRALAMGLVTPLIYSLWAAGAVYLMRKDPTSPRMSFSHFFEAGRSGRLPRATNLLYQIIKYAHPGYHPSQTGSIAQAREFLARSMVVAAAR